MILSISSSLPKFKILTFHVGLNVLLADTVPEASNKHTRNSAGKTSLVEIIHFIFGADCKPDSIFRHDDLVEVSFRATILIAGEEFEVERSGSDPSKIFVLRGGRDRPALKLKLDKLTEREFVPNSKWKDFLGSALFGLPTETKGTIFEQSHSPSFRSMFSYFVRRRNSGGFLAMERQAEDQQRWDWQVNISYLLGLDWTIGRELEDIRAKERSLKEIRKAAKDGALGDIIGTVADLRPKLALAEKREAELSQRLSSFEVIDSFKEMSKEASQAKSSIQSLTRDSISLQEALNHLQEAMTAEVAPGREDLERLYSAVGVELPDMAIRRFEEVARFHDSVVRNRRTHLQEEIVRIRQKLTQNEREIAAWSAQRAHIMKNLEGGGALEDFMEMQREYSEVTTSAASLRERFKAAEMLEGEATQLDVDRGRLKRRLQTDHLERKDTLNEAVLTIASFIEELYSDREGRFVVSANDNGPEFKIWIEGDRGGGIANMEIFCFDLALFVLSAKRGWGPGFLVHDSHLFDGVDERQVASALALGKRVALEVGGQYIVTMNSDIFSKLPDINDLREDMLPQVLSDQGDEGGLFGIRFG